MRRPFEIAAFCAAALLAAMSLHAWLAARADQLRLHATISAQKQLLDAAARRESVRDAALKKSVAQIDALQRERQSPREILRALPKFLPLPQPLMFPAQAPAGQGTAAPENSAAADQDLPSAPVPALGAQIPAADLKPLYNFALGCRACQEQLAAAQKDRADDAAKIAALARERDAAVTAAKGGRFLQRLRRNALWFAIGAAAGYAAHR